MTQLNKFLFSRRFKNRMPDNYSILNSHVIVLSSCLASIPWLSLAVSVGSWRLRVSLWVLIRMVIEARRYLPSRNHKPSCFGLICPSSVSEQKSGHGGVPGSFDSFHNQFRRESCTGFVIFFGFIKFWMLLTFFLREWTFLDVCVNRKHCRSSVFYTCDKSSCNRPKS